MEVPVDVEPVLKLRCVVCGSQRHRRVFRKGLRDFVRCDTCNILRLSPLPSFEELEQYYEKFQLSGSPLAAEEAMARVTARSRLDFIRPYMRGNRWLDVGCHVGIFLDELSKIGISGEGIDISRTAVEKARRRGVTAYVATAESFFTATAFDVITLFDVIEHVRDPVSLLKSLFELLKPGGILVFTTPDTASLICLLMRKFWYFYIPDQHLFYFSRHNLPSLLKKQGFHVLQLSRAYKALNYNYVLVQFRASNPLIHWVWKGLGSFIPSSWRQRPFSLYIGEMMIVARKQT